MKKFAQLWWLAFVLLLVAGCGDQGEQTEVTTVPPTPTLEITPTQTVMPLQGQNFIVVATDAPNPPYTLFDEFGVVDGFDGRVLQAIAANANLDVELIVTPFEGVLANIADRDRRDFDAVIANLVIPDEPPAGIVYTTPYLEMGQVLVVLADNETIQSYQELQPGMLVGVVQNSAAETAARDLVGVASEDLVNSYENGVQALQSLIDEEMTAVIIDSTLADYYTQRLPDQLKIVGGNGRDAWITSKAYGLALAADNTELLEKFNTAITAAQQNGDIEREITTWLIPLDPLQPGESRVGTPADELFIGILGTLPDMDPAAQSDLISWEVKNNTMSGLYRFNASNELAPLLAAGMPVISEDGLEYTINLQPNLLFPDGSELTAEDVKWSVDRARDLGSFTVNSVLKDSDGNFYADQDSVQIIDQYTVKFVLQAPTSYFPALLATPPFSPISRDCFAETADPQSICGGIGPYTIVEWLPGDRMQLQANPDWPGRPLPAFANITLRFYDDPASMRRSLSEFGSIDMAWRGLPYTDFVELQSQDANGDGQPDYVSLVGPSDFKSYIIFDQNVEPWTNPQVRRAVGLALDRDALAMETFNGSRIPLLSPVPDAVPGHVPTLPTRDLTQAQSLLQTAGYNAATPLEMEFWYVSDGRYSAIEEAYAVAIKTQLEETGVFSVTLNSAPFEQFRAQVGNCGYPAYLLGWPAPGRPVDYLDVMAWTEFFVTSNSFCANYDSPIMTALVESILKENDSTARLALYAQMQEKWAADLPTLDILQQPTHVISLPEVNHVAIDALGLLHYEVLTKEGE